MDNSCTEEQVGAHHCTPESIRALLNDLDAIGECREIPPLADRDHRGMAGVVACVIRHLLNVLREEQELRMKAHGVWPEKCDDSQSH